MVRATTEIADICYELLVDILRPGVDELQAIAGGEQVSHLERGGRDADSHVEREILSLFYRPSGTLCL